MQKNTTFFTEEDFALSTLPKVNCTLYGKDAVAIEGHKGLKKFSLDKIQFKADKLNLICVVGNDLSIKQLCQGYALVVGQISGVWYESL
ncbi:MAG: YabP/YqfC family sporulation protein [Clostridia bacterium]|nr:YabP/YqfC family sporulation protein [Clostridia bacterium]